jgi:hypothetical protein
MGKENQMKLLVYLLAWLFWAVIAAAVALAFGCDLRVAGIGRGAFSLLMAFVTIRLIKIYTEDKTE